MSASLPLLFGFGHAYPATELPYALVAWVLLHCLLWPEVGI